MNDILTEKEKKILRFIFENPGNSQKKLCDKLEFSASYMSLFLKKAEYLMLIIRYKRINENRIHPTKKTIELFKEDYFKFRNVKK